MSDSTPIDDDLSRSGFAVVGKIDLTLIENVKKHLKSPAVKQRYNRQTELNWSSDCDFVVAYFETVSQQNLPLPRLKSRLVYFHESPQPSEIYRPPFGKGELIVIIIIRRGSGFPLLYERSYASDGGNVDSTTTISTRDIWNDEGSVVMFEADIARQEPAVEGTGGSGILLWY
ncbi:MAG: hypothetical protein M1839_003204 [Geoglossum umbratile]|nr:MAG: hypothetical protein M1839_003204 [Geoglossum umbratile]